MVIEQTMTWLQNLPLPTRIRESEWLFPTIETVHVFALVLVIGSIVTVDLRLLGFANRDRPFSQLAREMLPWTAVAGALMFTSKALTYFGNIPFRIKMLCLLFAGVNMLLFHWVGSRHLANWDASRPPPAARFAGAVSLLLWTTIVATGRWIGFTT